MKDITPKQARTILHEWFWKVVKGDDLPADLAIVLFDTGVNSGAENSVERLQEMLGISPTGFLGEQTKEAIKNYKGDLVTDYLKARLKAYENIATNDPSQKKFLQGWLNRISELRAYLAKERLRPAAQSPGAPLPARPQRDPTLKPSESATVTNVLPYKGGTKPPTGKPSAPAKPYSLKDKFDFLGDVHRLAKPISDETGLSLPMVLAQAAYETGWGRRVDGNNLFNLKAGEDWEGPTTARDNAEYRAYPSREESMNDYLAFLQDNPSFGHMFDPDATGSLEKIAAALRQGGYTDDPAYGIKIRETALAPTFRHALSIFGTWPRGEDEEE